MKTETETQIRVLADIRFTKSAEEPLKGATCLQVEMGHFV